MYPNKLKSFTLLELDYNCSFECYHNLLCAYFLWDIFCKFKPKEKLLKIGADKLCNELYGK